MNACHLENRPSHFIELPDDGTEESNKILSGLNSTSAIPDGNNKQPPDLPNLEAKKTKKKEKKAQRRHLRKSTKVGVNSATITIGGSLFPVASGSLSSAAGSGLSLLFSVIGGSFLSTTIASGISSLLVLVACGGFLSAIAIGNSLSSITGDSLFSLFSTAGDGFLSTVAGVDLSLLSFITNSGLVSVIAGGGLLSLVASSGLSSLSFVASGSL